MKAPFDRLQVLGGTSLLVLLGLSARAWDLGIRRHDEMRTRAEYRRRRAEVLPASRRAILDRRDRPLAIDVAVDDVVVSLPDLDPSLDLVVPLARALGLERAGALGLLRQAASAATAGEDEVLLGRVHLGEATRIQRLLGRQEGVRLEVGPNGVEVWAATALFAQRRETLTRLAEALEQDAPALEERFQVEVERIHAEEDRSERLALWRRPLVVLQDAPFPVVARLTERAFELPGVAVRRRYVRRYPQGEVAAHVVGTLGAPTGAELRRDAALLLDGDREALGTLMGERTTLSPEVRLRDETRGRTGLERAHDASLRGTPGVRVLVRDARGTTRQTLLDLPPRDGEDLRTTLDVDLQAALEAALDEAVATHGDPQAGGAGVLIDLRGGDVLALASSPRYDPNTFSSDFGRLVSDPRRPLLQRAVMAYAPGSTWKVLVALAATDPADPDALPAGWTTTCNGRLLERGPNRFHCDGVHGQTDLVEALERSCNVFFFRAGDRRGLEPTARWAERLGLGQPSGCGLPGEQAGLVPRDGYKAARAERALEALGVWARRVGAHDPRDGLGLSRILGRLSRAAWWYEACSEDQLVRPGDVWNASIGQGDVMATPIQVATIAALVATGGRPPQPRLDRDQAPSWRELPLDARVLAKVRQGMRRCVTHGTASASKIGLRALDVAGKTGTAERQKDQPKLAWFMGYYPASRPEVAFAILVDRTLGHGGEVCGPVARRLVEAYQAAQAGGAR